nr:MAG TPA: hypothetical protein [Caudoviricetes sp.]
MRSAKSNFDAFCLPPISSKTAIKKHCASGSHSAKVLILVASCKQVTRKLMLSLR